MNPFNLPGPFFLLFYAVLSAAVLAAQLFWQRAGEAPGPAGRLTDPYLIAYLRGGVPEALRLACLSLIDRGRLRLEGDTLVATGGSPDDRRLERAVLAHFAAPRTASTVFELKSAAGDEHLALEEMGLLPDANLRQRRAYLALLTAVVLLLAGAIKIVIALDRGHTNIWFLVLLTALAVFLATRAAARLTRRGREALADLRTLFRGLEARAAGVGSGTNDAIYLAAVFGFGALAASPVHGYMTTLFPRATETSSSGCGTIISCGSSSSCGGGGCGGGGCGGCGGCGS